MSRIRTAAVALLLSAVVILPSFASAQAVTLQQQLENLLMQISALEATATTSATTSASMQSSLPATLPASSAPAQSNPTNLICPTFARTLSLGSSGTDVANLQGFLAQNPIIYPEGAVTAYFGMLTQDAVQRWQSVYHIVSSGTPSTTGYGVVGPRTAAAMTASCANQSSAVPTAPTPLPGQEPLCAIAPQPATPCAGTWSPVTNATGCTIAWQCTITIPGTATVTASTPASSTVGTTSSACPAYTLPLCTNGTVQWLGISNNCNLGYQCIPSRAIMLHSL